MTEAKIFMPTPYKWRIIVPGVDASVHVTKRPSLVRRFFWRLFFGITWEEMR